MTPPNPQVSSTCSNWVGSFILVPLTGIEPVRSKDRGILSPLRLPVSPQRQEAETRN